MYGKSISCEIFCRCPSSQDIRARYATFSLFFSFFVFLCLLALLRLSAGTICSVIKCSEREYRGSTLEVLFPENYSTVPVVTCYPRTSNYYGRENRHRVDSADLFGLPFLLKFPPPFAVDRFYRLQSLLRAPALYSR